MSDGNDQDAAKGRLSLRPASRTEVGRTVDAGSVRQSFSHGRSKVVQVEVRKKRAGPVTMPTPQPPAPTGGGPAPAPRPAAPARPPVGAGRALTASELATRQRVLAEQAREQARREAERREQEKISILSAAEEARRREEEAKKAAEEEARRAVEQAEIDRREAEERRVAEAQSAAQAAAQAMNPGARSAPVAEPVVTRPAPAAPAAPQAQRPAGNQQRPATGATPAETLRLRPTAEEDDSRRRPGGAPGAPGARKVPAPAAKKTTDDRRRTGKIDVQAAIEGEDDRVRSLASVRRQRERERRQAELERLRADQVKVVREVVLPDHITVQELANRMATRGPEVIKALMKMGVMATITQSLDADTAELVVQEFGHRVKRVSEDDVELGLVGVGDNDAELQPRPPVVTVMGHVDHGKTSLLDAIRTSKVAAGEAGGITQAIGAYHVDVKFKEGPDRQIVFIDTPGHEAFTKMRARGAKVTDIVVLVVAADDGVMPQTIEAINHTKAADVPMIVAINKIDKPGANPDKVEQMLLQYGIQTEAYGGEVPCVRVSAKTKEGLDVLLETALLVADLKDLKAVYDCPAAGSILEARLDRGRGPVATVLVQQGTLHAGEIFVAGATMGRVRAMFNDRGEKISEATPSMAVQILGFEEVAVSGDNLQVLEDESKARTIVGFRQEKAKAAAQTKQRVTLENLFSTLKEGQIKELPLIIKGDTAGSVESLVGSLERLSTEKVRVRIIHSAAGTVTENDVLLAEASKATIIAFSTKAERKAEDLAQEEGVDIRFHDIIYKVTEEIAAAMMGLLDAIEKETVQGQAEVRQIFKVNKSVIAGSFVTEGKVQKGYKARVKRGIDVIWEGDIKTLKRFKDDVHEVKNGLDCGIDLEGFTGLREGDLLEFYTREKVAATSLG